jgi:hypothetical protein
MIGRIIAQLPRSRTLFGILHLNSIRSASINAQNRGKEQAYWEPESCGHGHALHVFLYKNTELHNSTISGTGTIGIIV